MFKKKLLARKKGAANRKILWIRTFTGGIAAPASAGPALIALIDSIPFGKRREVQFHATKGYRSYAA